MKHLAHSAFPLCLAALSVAAQLLPMPVRVRMKDGRTFECVLLERSNDVLRVERRIGTSLAREPLRVARIDTIEFPLPSIVTSINVRALRNKDERRAARRAVELACAEWQVFRDIKGNHYATMLRLYADVLERSGAYTAAERKFRLLERLVTDDATRRYASARRAVCAFWSNTNGIALTALTNLAATASSDAERAEFLFYAGVSHAQRGEHVAALFALMKNSVFYSMHDAWEARSLTAALPSFAALGRKDEFVITCTTLTQRFPGTVWATIAHDRLAALAAGTNISALASITSYLPDEP